MWQLDRIFQRIAIFSKNTVYLILCYKMLIRKNIH